MTMSGDSPRGIANGCNMIEYTSLQMQEMLGKGFFGEVRRAIWKGAEVAVKVRIFSKFFLNFLRVFVVFFVVDVIVD